MMRTVLRTEGMHCDGCADHLRYVLDRGAGVSGAEVSHPESRAVARHDDRVADKDRPQALVEQAGFTVELGQ